MRFGEVIKTMHYNKVSRVSQVNLVIRECAMLVCVCLHASHSIVLFVTQPPFHAAIVKPISGVHQSD